MEFGIRKSYQQPKIGIKLNSKQIILKTLIIKLYYDD